MAPCKVEILDSGLADVTRRGKPRIREARILRVLIISLFVLVSVGATIGPDYASNLIVIPTVTVHPPTSTTVTGVPTWGISVTPTSRTVPPGGSTTFSVAVSGTVTGNPKLYLEVGWGGGIESSSWAHTFSPSTGVAPFVSTLSITIMSWASPGERIILVGARTLEGGAGGEKIVTIRVIVPAAAWDLSVTPASRIAVPGDPVGTTYGISITGSISGNPNIHLSAGAPIAATFEFSANDRPAPFVSTMRVRVDAAAPVGSRLITVNADPAGSEPVKSTQVTLVVEALAVWDLSVNPTTRNVAPGGSTTFTVSVTGMLPGNPLIHLMIGGPVIVGISTSFSVNDRPAPFTSTLTVSVGASVAALDYSRTVIADPAGGFPEKTVTVHVIVGVPSSAWGFSISPASRTISPGGTTSFTVSITGTSGGTSIQLLQSPPILGISVSFSTNNLPAPYTSIMYVTVDSSKAAGSYPMQVYAHPAGTLFPGPDNKYQIVNVIVGATAPTVATTDWSLSNPTMNPVSVRVGDSATFSVALRSLSTDRPYPQSVRIEAVLDGTLLGGSTLSYAGPTGTLATVTLTTPWTAREGSHTIVWTVDPAPYQYNDPNRYNNQASMSFSVSATPPSFDFSISVSPPTQEVSAGKSTSYLITISLAAGAAQPVTLSLAGLPSGVTYSLNPLSSNPTFQSTLEVQAPASAEPGTYDLTLTGSGGGVTKIVALGLEIQAPEEEDFIIIVTPGSSTIEQGEIVTQIVRINAVAGFKSAVTLSASGLPAGVTASFSQSSLTPDSTSTLTLRTSKGTPAGAHAITILASGGGKTHDTTVTLNVKEKTLSAFDIISENSLIIAGLLAALIIALAALATRKPRAPPTPPSAPKKPTTFCTSCGSAIPDDSEFCPKCGTKKERT